jgi:hypothetical protein
MTEEFESFLRDRRPEPRREFVDELEQRLVAAPRRRRGPLLFTVASATAILIVVLGVAGALPLGLGSDEHVRATNGCVTVMVERTVRRPVFMVDRAGELRVTYRTEHVRRPERRCDRR